MRKLFTKHPIISSMIYCLLIGLIASVFFLQYLKWWPILGGLVAGLVLGMFFDQALRHQLAEERQYSHFVHALKPELKPLPDPLTSLFLYNTLHNISALMVFAPDVAGATIEKLANLVRSISELRRANSTSLGEEFKAAGLYLEVEKARLGDRLIVEKEFDPDFFEIPFPSLTLYPFVDHCVRYGAEMNVNPVTVSLICRREKNDLIIQISEKSEGEDDEKEPMIERNRISAFEVAKQRLADFFGSSMRITRQKQQPLGEIITVKIPLNNAKIGRYSR